MKTLVTDSPTEAARFISAGGIVAFPTETVYGLGANVFDERAIEKIFAAKRRPSDNPLIVHVASPCQISLVASSIPETAQSLIKTFFPGPLTVVLPKRETVSSLASAGLSTIGVRMPKNTIANTFISECDTPIVAPSANLSGKPSPTTWQAVFEDLNGRVDCILKGDATEIGLESTVVDCTEDPPILLRPGAISMEQIQATVPSIQPISGEQQEIRSPGMRHQHYSPSAAVRLIYSGDSLAVDENSAFIGLHDRPSAFSVKRICGSVDEYARDVFEFFRECDRHQIATIYCEAITETGIGAALMDRLLRASKSR